MSTVKRTIEADIEAYLTSQDNKILFIWGPRRSGKTTLIRNLAQKLGANLYNFDLVSDREKFVPRLEVLQKLVEENKIILIDEVQNYPEVTVVLKILYDEFNIKIIATGSSELRQKSAEEFDTLASRYQEIYCLPLSVSEIFAYNQPKPTDQQTYINKVTKDIQIWGTYPEVHLSSQIEESKRIDLLQRILDTYVLKDIISIYELRNQKLAKDILTKIALQLGSEVSIRELANSLGAQATTVANYIEIFVKNYILIPLPSFKTNIRKAVSENKKYYFYDLGIRNILIQDFREPELRQDKGGVFENFIISELEKRRRVKNSKVNFYFYREYGGKEVDLVIEDYKKNYTAVEIKATRGKVQNIFPLPHTSEVITVDNYYSKLFTT